RADLYYRLSVAVLRIPALAARREDIPLLFLHLLRESAARHARAPRDVPAARLAALAAQDWPGNVRELRNASERFALGLEGLSEEDSAPPGHTRLAERMADYERSVIAGAIAAHQGRLKSVYETLGISRKTLYEKMQRH